MSTISTTKSLTQLVVFGLLSSISPGLTLKLKKVFDANLPGFVTYHFRMDSFGQNEIREGLCTENMQDKDANGRISLSGTSSGNYKNGSKNGTLTYNETFTYYPIGDPLAGNVTYQSGNASMTCSYVYGEPNGTWTMVQNRKYFRKMRNLQTNQLFYETVDRPYNVTVKVKFDTGFVIHAYSKRPDGDFNNDYSEKPLAFDITGMNHRPIQCFRS